MNKTIIDERYPFDVLIEMCERLNVSNITTLPGCWEYQIDEAWWVAVNGHKEPCTALSPTDRQYDREAALVPPFTAYLELETHPSLYKLR